MMAKLVIGLGILLIAVLLMPTATALAGDESLGVAPFVDNDFLPFGLFGAPPPFLFRPVVRPVVPVVRPFAPFARPFVRPFAPIVRPGIRPFAPFNRAPVFGEPFGD